MKRKIYQAICDCGRPATHLVGSDAECERCRELRIWWNDEQYRYGYEQKNGRKHHDNLQAHEDAA